MISKPAASARRSGPVRFRRYLESKGPAFIKIGQYLALRPDLLPQQYCDELLKLLDEVRPFPWSQAEAILKNELGDEPRKLFDFIDPAPSAAGSLAQVHRAKLKDGTIVAVKIQRPNIQQRVDRGLDQALKMAIRLKRAKRLRLLELLPVNWARDLSMMLDLVEPKDLIDELREWMRQELDFGRELRNLTRLRRLTARSPVAKVPRPIPNLSTSKVLTAEYLQGVAFSEILAVLRSRNSDEMRRLDELGVDCPTLANHLMNSSLEQIFHYKFFHADLHPGNLIALADNKIGFVDFGLCAELDETIRKSQLQYITAVYSDDAESVFRVLSDILVETEKTDMERFHRDFIAETRRFESQRETDGEMDRQRTPFAEYLIALMQSARKNHLMIPTRVLSLYRTVLTIETVVKELGAARSLREVGLKFFGRLQIEELFLQSVNVRELAPTLVNLLSLTREGPRQLNEVLTQLADGTYNWKAYVSEASRTTQMRNTRARMVTAAVLSVGVALLLTLPPWPGTFGIIFQRTLVGALILLYLWILLLWRKLK